MKKTLLLLTLLFFSSASALNFNFTLTNSTGGKSFVLGDSIILTANETSNFSAIISASDDEWFFHGNFNHVMQIKTSISDVPGEWNVTVSNGQASKSEIINTVLRGEDAYYGVNFNSPVQAITYERGDAITISVQVFRGAQNLAGASVKALIGEDEVVLNEVGQGVYTGDYVIPKNSTTTNRLVKVEAQKSLPQGLRMGGAFLNLHVKPSKINFTIEQPVKKDFNPGDSINFVIAVNNYSQQTIGAVTINGEVIQLSTNGQYLIGDYTIPTNSSRLLSARIEVTDAYANSGEETVNFLVNSNSFLKNPLLWIAGFAILIPALISTLFFSVKFARKQMLYYYISKQDDLKRMQNITEKKYFDRLIDEETYMDLMRKHEAQLVNVQTSIKELKKKLGIKGGKRAKK